MKLHYKCNLIYLGFKGCKFTWSNHGRKNNELIMERLDHILANEEWVNKFSNATITHLPKIYSDHNPILVKINNCFNYSNKPFRLENIWCTRPNFINVVATNWENKKLLEATKTFSKNIQIWGEIIFGSIFRNKKRILARFNWHSKLQQLQPKTFPTKPRAISNKRL